MSTMDKLTAEQLRVLTKAHRCRDRNGKDSYLIMILPFVADVEKEAQFNALFDAGLLERSPKTGDGIRFRITDEGVARVS